MFGMYEYGGNYQSFTEFGKVLFAIKQVLVEGASRFIFCIVFGVGILVSAKGEHAKIKMYLRAAALVTVGTLNILLFQWIGDFLVVFGIASILGFCFHKYKPTTLLITAFICSVGFFSTYSVLVSPIQQSWEDAKNGNSTEWVATQKAHTVEMEKKDSLRSNGLSGGFRSVLKSGGLMITSWILHDIAEAVVLILVGMALYKYGYFGLRGMQLRYAAWITVIIGVCLNIVLVRWQIQHDFDFYVSNSRMFPIYRIANLFMALGWISLFMWLANTGKLTWLRDRVSDVGRMALSNYLLQSAIMVSVFHGFEQFGRFGVTELFLFAVCIWVVQLCFSSLWLRYRKNGPVEEFIKEFIGVGIDAWVARSRTSISRF